MGRRPPKSIGRDARRRRAYPADSGLRGRDRDHEVQPLRVQRRGGALRRRDRSVRNDEPRRGSELSRRSRRRCPSGWISCWPRVPSTRRSSPARRGRSTRVTSGSRTSRRRARRPTPVGSAIPDEEAGERTQHRREQRDADRRRAPQAHSSDTPTCESPHGEGHTQRRRSHPAATGGYRTSMAERAGRRKARTTRVTRRSCVRTEGLFRGEGSNLHSRLQRPVSCH